MNDMLYVLILSTAIFMPGSIDIIVTDSPMLLKDCELESQHRQSFTNSLTYICIPLDDVLEGGKYRHAK